MLALVPVAYARLNAPIDFPSILRLKQIVDFDLTTLSFSPFGNGFHKPGSAELESGVLAFCVGGYASYRRTLVKGISPTKPLIAHSALYSCT